MSQYILTTENHKKLYNNVNGFMFFVSGFMVQREEAARKRAAVDVLGDLYGRGKTTLNLSSRINSRDQAKLVEYLKSLDIEVQAA
jgi:hypothetical protein